MMRSTKDGRSVHSAADLGVDSLEFITLARAAQAAPGRPSANALWRWCRRGVLARSGERVRLQHIRQGGRVFTRIDWLEEFGKRLAEADVAHFDARSESPIPPRDPAYGPPSGRGGRRRPGRIVENDSEIAKIERELEEEGL